MAEVQVGSKSGGEILVASIKEECVTHQVNNMLQVVYNIKAIIRALAAGDMTEEQAFPIIDQALGGVEVIANDIKVIIR